MTKKNLWYGLLYITSGLLFFIACIFCDGKISSLYAGFAGAGLGGGIALIWKYFYWHSPKHVKEYEEKLAEEDINLHDERNEMYRDKSGRYAYIVSMIIIPLSIIVFAILNAFDIYNSQVIIVYLSALWIGLYVIGILIYRRLKRE